MTLSADNFNKLVKFIYDNSGIVITIEKTYLIEARLAPILQNHGFSTLNQLVDQIENSSSPVCKEIIEAITTNESSFFRDIKPFEYLKTTIIPDLLNKFPEKLTYRIWCAASSTGQEPYSIAMNIAESMAANPNYANKKFEIIATDIDTKVLDIAKKGIYSQFEVQRGVPIPLLMKYFTQSGDKWQVKDEIRNYVKFDQLNLMKPCIHLGKFDIIFCRNVLIYFDKETKEQVLNQISECMDPHSTLFLGSTETVLGMDVKFQMLANACPGALSLK